MLRRLRIALRLIALIVLALAGEAYADLTGHWHVESSFDPFSEVVQTGGTVSMTLSVGGTPYVFEGTVNGTSVFVSSDDPPCPIGVSLTLLPDDATLDGVSTAYGGSCTFPSKAHQFMTRCECFDGNSTDGDGCDASCRIEPCFVCSGAPSVCTPAGDGAPCDDRHDCTTAETCTAGVCGGGSPVAPCVDMTGQWFTHLESDFGNFDSSAYVEQRNETVIFRSGPGGSAGSAGTIDSSTGAFTTSTQSTLILCSQPGVFTGTAALDNRTFTGTGYALAQTPHGCFGIAYSEQGFRCGSGTIDPDETCDDGNFISGDGCSNTCQIEPCFDCSGVPSACSPRPPMSPCDDGDLCTFGDTCSDGVCVGSPAACGACAICDGAGGCLDAPRTDCHGSLDPAKSLLQITDKTPDGRDALKWQWRAGSAITPAALGDPLTTNAVAACLYDTSTATPTLLFRAVVPAGGICGTKACWKPSGGGFQYKSKAGAEGIVGLSLRPGVDGKSRVDVKGAGAGLAGHPFGLPAPPLPVPMRMQVQVQGAGCFEVDHGTLGVRANEPGAFKGRGTP